MTGQGRVHRSAAAAEAPGATGPSPRAALALRILVALQVAAIVAAGAATVFRFEVWAPIDEAAHFDYVRHVAEERRLPVLGRDLVAPEVVAIAEDTYPSLEGADPRRAAFGGSSYEAFQPPLYYLLAAPAYLLADDHLAKVRTLRTLDLALLLAAIAVLLLLARRAFGPRWPLPFSVGLTVFLWPSVVVRGVTVSNTALELPLTLLFLYMLWRADAERSARRLVAAGALLGLCLLTKLTLAYLAPLLLAVAVRHVLAGGGRRPLAAAGAAVLVPLALLAPWIAFNLDRYDALTANRIALEMQRPIINLNHDYTVGEVPGRFVDLLRGYLPQEWEPTDPPPALQAVGDVLRVLFLAAVPLLLLAAPRLRGDPRVWLLVSPLVLGFVLLTATLLAENWDIFIPRYLYPAFAALALVVGVAWRRLLRSEGRAVALCAATSLYVAVVWVYLAGTRYFLDVGDRLGL